MTGPYPLRLRASRLDGGAPTYYPSSPLTKEKQCSVIKKACRFGLHASPRRELSDVRGRQEVHHRLFTYLHGKQLRYLCPPAPARFPARCLPHLLPELPLLVFPPAAVTEEMLPCLGHRSPAPPALVVLPVSEPF